MHNFFHKKILSPFLAILLAAACILGTAFLCGFWSAGRTGEPIKAEQPEAEQLPLEQLYEDAVADAITAEENEIYPLVEITRDGDQVSWREDQILLLTVNDTPELYEGGKTVELPGEVWTFTDREIKEWYPEHKEGVTDWTLRLSQLVGVPPDAGYTHVTAMWVRPEDVIRPACLTDIESGTMETRLPKDTPEEYRKWYEGNILWSYFDSAYPWTRLGYTYDWAPGSGEYGVTEFLILPGASVEIEYTETISQFVERLEDGT